MVNDSPKPGESWLEFFRSKGQFGDTILLAWVTCEFFMNQLFTKQFDMYFDYPEAKILVKMSFYKKLEYLRKFEIVSEEEFKIVREVLEFRNQLFHGNNPEYLSWSESKKEKFMDKAINAYHIIRDALASGKKIKKTGTGFTPNSKTKF